MVVVKLHRKRYTQKRQKGSIKRKVSGEGNRETPTPHARAEKATDVKTRTTGNELGGGEHFEEARQE